KVLPTAHKSLAAEPATPSRKSWPVAGMVAPFTTCQLLPLKCSISGSKEPPPFTSPTAQTLIAPMAATLFSSAPAGSFDGLGTADQLEPFQCSMRLCPLLPVSLPTAHTSPDVTAATACRRVSSAAGRAAEGEIDQAPWLRCSTRARNGPLPTREKPTVHASPALTLATPS